MRRLAIGDVVLRPKEAPLLLTHVVDEGVTMGDFYEFRDLETGGFRKIPRSRLAWLVAHRAWRVLERSHPATTSGSVVSDHSLPSEAPLPEEKETVMKKRILTNSQRRTSIPAAVGMSDPSEAPTTPAPAEKPARKAKKTRTVDYTRTDKRPHSFRYKRGSTFVARAGSVSLSKESDGALVIGTASDGAQANAATLEGGTLELVSVRKRPNGKTAIAFKRVEDGVEVVAYDARDARAALRAS